MSVSQRPISYSMSVLVQYTDFILRFCQLSNCIAVTPQSHPKFLAGSPSVLGLKSKPKRALITLTYPLELIEYKAALHWAQSLLIISARAKRGLSGIIEPQSARAHVRETSRVLQSVRTLFLPSPLPSHCRTLRVLPLYRRSHILRQTHSV